MRAKPVNECPVPRGILVVIGGKEDKGEAVKDADLENKERLEILKTFVALTGKKRPVLEIVTSASSEGKEMFLEYEKVFRELGLHTIGHIHHDSREDVLKDSEECLRRLQAAEAIFFCGGDQLKLTTLYGGSVFLLEMKQKYIKEPVVIGGTSAGAMALSTPMIYAGNKEVQQIGGEIKITTGLEFLKDVCIDTHFVDRSRFIRMAQVIASNPGCTGVGIEEDTAMVVRNGLDAEVCGNGIVILMDGRQITSTNLPDAASRIFSVRGLQVNILSKDDTFTIPQTNPPHI